jgi:hypothetical protein
MDKCAFNGLKENRKAAAGGGFRGQGPLGEGGRLRLTAYAVSLLGVFAMQKLHT